MQNPTPSPSTEIKISADDLGLGGAPTTVDSASVSGILDIVYLIAGIVAVMAIIFGGVRYVTANGDSSQIQAAKNTIMYAVVGLVVILMAAAITTFVVKGVVGDGGGENSSGTSSTTVPADAVTPDEE